MGTSRMPRRSMSAPCTRINTRRETNLKTTRSNSSSKNLTAKNKKLPSSPKKRSSETPLEVQIEMENNTMMDVSPEKRLEKITENREDANNSEPENGQNINGDDSQNLDDYALNEDQNPQRLIDNHQNLENQATNSEQTQSSPVTKKKQKLSNGKSRLSSTRGVI